MASGGEVVVDVKADISNFERGMSTVDRRLTRTGRSTVSVRGHFDGLLQSVRAMRREAEDLADSQATLARETDHSSSALARGAARAAAAGVGLFVLSQNLKEIGHEFGAAGRAGNFLGNIMQGNVVGAIKAARAQWQPSKDEIAALARSSDGLTFALKAQALGWDGLARSVSLARAALAGGFAEANVAFQLAGQTALAAKDVIEARRAGDANLPAPPPPEATTVLPQRLQTALALAFAQGSRRNQVAQLKRAQAFLTNALGQKRLDDSGREELANALIQVNSQLEALTRPDKSGKEPPIVPLKLEDRLARAALQGVKQQVAALRDVESFLVRQIKIEKDINRRIQERQRLREVRDEIGRLTSPILDDSAVGRARSAIGGLFQGPVLTSPEFQFVQQFGFKARPKDLINDLLGQTRRGAQFNQALTSLKKRGAPAQLIQELLGAGTGSLDEIQTLAGLKGGQLNRIFNVFRKREQIAQQIAKLDVQTQQVIVNAGSVTVKTGGKPGSSTGAKFVETAAAARHF